MILINLSLVWYCEQMAELLSVNPKEMEVINLQNNVLTETSVTFLEPSRARKLCKDLPSSLESI